MSIILLGCSSDKTENVTGAVGLHAFMLLFYANDFQVQKFAGKANKGK